MKTRFSSRRHRKGMGLVWGQQQAHWPRQRKRNQRPIAGRSNGNIAGWPEGQNSDTAKAPEQQAQQEDAFDQRRPEDGKRNTTKPLWQNDAAGTRKKVGGPDAGSRSHKRQVHRRPIITDKSVGRIRLTQTLGPILSKSRLGRGKRFALPVVLLRHKGCFSRPITRLSWPASWPTKLLTSARVMPWRTTERCRFSTMACWQE